MRTRMIACLLMTVVAFGNAQAAADIDQDLAAQADAAFAKGVEHKTRIFEAPTYFAEAADAYHKLHDRGVRSAALYANLGNAAVLSDRWPEAIWAYQIGLKLDPNDAAMREHLAFARAKVIRPAAGQGRLDPDAWPTWLHRPTRYEVCLIGLLSYMLACLAVTGAYLRQDGRLVGLALALVAVASAAGIGLWHEERQAEIDRRTPIVVLQSNAEFYRGNGVGYPQHPKLPVLPRGMEVRQVHCRGQWLQVRLTTGEIGWVPRSQVLVVEP